MDNRTHHASLILKKEDNKRMKKTQKFMTYKIKLNPRLAHTPHQILAQVVGVPVVPTGNNVSGHYYHHSFIF